MEGSGIFADTLKYTDSLVFLSSLLNREKKNVDEEWRGGSKDFKKYLKRLNKYVKARSEPFMRNN